MRCHMIVEKETIQQVRTPQAKHHTAQAHVRCQEKAQQAQHDKQPARRQVHFYTPLQIIIGVQQQRRNKSPAELVAESAFDEDAIDEVYRSRESAQKGHEPDLSTAEQVSP